MIYLVAVSTLLFPAVDSTWVQACIASAKWNSTLRIGSITTHTGKYGQKTFLFFY